MNMRTLIGVAGAAALAFSSAHAVKIDGDYSVTYAKETLRKAADTGEPATLLTVSGVTYYVLEPSHMIEGPADISANNTDTTDYEVVFTLQDMVFSVALSGSSLTSVLAGTTTVGATFTLQRGGAMEDNFAVFHKASGEAIATDDMLTLAASFAVTADGPGGIVRMITNEALPSAIPGIKISMTHTNSDAVKVARALKETVMPAEPMPKADAGDNFMNFTGGTAQSPRLYASLGTVMVGVTSGIRDARVAANNDGNQTPDIDDRMVTLTGLDGVPTNAGIIATAAILDMPDDTEGTAVTFSGAFDFLKTVAVDSGGCAGSLTEIRKPSEDDRTVLTDETRPMAAGEFATAKHLCVAVDGETAIPNTGAYTATTEYKGPALNMFPPVGATHQLAAIGRSGSTFRIPFLTVNARHNQRINIVNRGAATTYTLGELATIGDSVSALDMASGDLPQGQTALLVTDLIEIMGAMRASGTLSMPADSGTIDVSTDIVNKENGSIDTVYVKAE